MKRKIKYIMVIMAMLIAAFSIPAQAANEELKITLDSKNAAEVTSVRLGLKVSGVSDKAEVEVAFSDKLPKKTIQKTTYKDGILRIYIAGTEKLFGDGNELVIGSVEVKNDAKGAKNFKTELLADSVEIINGMGAAVDYAEGELKMSGGSFVSPEEPDEPEEPDNPDDKEEPETPTEEIARERLEGLLAELNKLLSSEYTAESWNSLYEIMQKAEKMLADGASKEEMDDIYSKLLEARKALVKAEEEKAPGNVGNGSSGQGSQNGENGAGTDRDHTVKTGDTANIMLWVILGLAAVAAVVAMVIYKKKRQLGTQ